MAEDFGTISYVSWVRRGLACGQTIEDSGSGGDDKSTIDVDVTFNANVDAAKVKLDILGPGDIIGLDPSVIVRTWPKANEDDAEYRHFALVELDQADLPWRYTPAKENPAGQLRPWLSLIVVEEGGAEGNFEPGSAERPLPSLRGVPGTKLPNPAEAWAWAHTQLEGAHDPATPASIVERIKGARGLAVARLLCPRILEANKNYLACVVPTFERGRLIGLGQDPGAVPGLDPAWATTPSGYDLPVYYHWRFRTGNAGSFEQLVRQITPRVIAADLGRREIAVNTPGFELPAVSSAAFQVEGALQSLAAAAAGPGPWPEPSRSQWISALKDLLNGGRRNGLRVVVPPLYGQWYAAQSKLDRPVPLGSNPPWFYELNTDPRARIAAALGTQVIQREQQALLASGWHQVGDLNEVNAWLRQLQLAREASQRLFTRHVVTGDVFNFLMFTARLHGRIQCNGEVVCEEHRQSRIGRTFFDMQWRRFTRPFGQLGRYQGRHLTTPVGPNLLERLNDGQNPAPESSTPIGLITNELLFESLLPGGLPPEVWIDVAHRGRASLRFWGLVLAWVARRLIATQSGTCYWSAIKLLRLALSLTNNSTEELDIQVLIDLLDGECTGVESTARPSPNFTVATAVPNILPLPPLNWPPGVDSPDAAAFRQALVPLCNDTHPPIEPPFPPATDPDFCRGEIEIALDPRVLFVTLRDERITLDSSISWHPKDPLEPIFAPPEYERPMYHALGDISQDWILPGLGTVPRETAGMVVTNQRFVEAYMAGLNHEMSRELLWNEFPTDQRGTYFRQFWDATGRVPSALSTIPAEGLRDVFPLALWNPAQGLGQNSPRPRLDPPGEYLVLLLRAQLIQRFPNVEVHAAKATAGATSQLSDADVHPIFSGLLPADVAFYGFPLSKDELLAGSGWYFVLQEQPGEPRFFVDGPPGAFAAPPQSTAAAAAQVAYEPPYRIGIHAATLLP